MQEEGFRVVALHLYNGFNGSIRRDIEMGPSWKWTPSEDVVRGAERLGIELVTQDVTDEFIDVILNPRHGYGSGVNPCIDCRIFILKKAHDLMVSEGAGFVFTGEVLGQRPMSQHRNALDLVDRRCGLEGRLLRPLSAKLLEPTLPESEGLVNRDNLYDISGRSRKPQKEIAARYGIDWYPNSGPGCFLTDKNFAAKLKDLYDHGIEVPSLHDLKSLKAGRHLRLDSGTKVIVGRTQVENEYLEALYGDTRWLFKTKEFVCASVYAIDEPAEDDFAFIAGLSARYGKGVNEENVAVVATKGSDTRELIVQPPTQEQIEPYFIAI